MNKTYGEIFKIVFNEYFPAYKEFVKDYRPYGGFYGNAIIVWLKTDDIMIFEYIAPDFANEIQEKVNKYILVNK